MKNRCFFRLAIEPNLNAWNLLGLMFFALLFTTMLSAEETRFKNSPGIALFIPPKGWQVADKSVLPPHIKILVVGPKLQNDMPPTMNLMIEPYQGDLKSYLKNVKKINSSHGDAWKDLGSLKTKAGDASLSQVEIRSKWGGEKLMHAIIVRDGYAYVLTATAAKNEFGRFYQLFYNSLRSLQIYNSVIETITDSDKRQKLEKTYAAIKDAFDQMMETEIQSKPTISSQVLREQAFQNLDFQNKDWNPFKTMLQQDFSDFGNEWQEAAIEELKDQLITGQKIG